MDSFEDLRNFEEVELNDEIKLNSNQTELFEDKTPFLIAILAFIGILSIIFLLFL